MTYYLSNNELTHHGILGMKWGVRRYQNEDGTLTEEGKRKYSSKERSTTSVETSTKNERAKMSDVELDARIRRLEKEVRLKDLEGKNIDQGQAYIESILKDVGKKVATTAASGALLYAGKAIISKEFNVADLGKAVFNGGAKKN